ncbi:MAG TPA: hypothetical protein VLI39_04275 [Sedimentisphaerales bacterium]|nr:hypothetical protein [Sedimentisphaerales bacterium]
MTRAIQPRRRAMRCSLYRFAISLAADSDRPLDPLTDRHLRTCDVCGRFHRTCRTLAAGLRSEAAAPSMASRHPACQILGGLPHTRRNRPIRFTVAAAASLVMAASVLWVNWRKPPTAPTIPLYAADVPHIELAAVWTHTLETSLLTEVRNLSEDASSGFRFLIACLAVRPFDGPAAPRISESAPPPVR